jgi:hypothetical protein
MQPFGLLSNVWIDHARVALVTYLVFDSVQEIKFRFEYLSIQYQLRTNLEACQRHGFVSINSRCEDDVQIRKRINEIRFEPLFEKILHHAATICFCFGIGFSNTNSLLFALLFEIPTFCQQIFGLFLIVYRNSTGTTKHHHRLSVTQAECATVHDYETIVATNDARLNESAAILVAQTHFLVPLIQFFSYASWMTFGIRLLIFVCVGVTDLVFKMEYANPVSWILAVLMCKYLRDNSLFFMHVFEKAKISKRCGHSHTLFYCN